MTETHGEFTYLENGCSASYTHGVKSGHWHHHAEVAYCRKCYGVNTPVKGEVFFHVKQHTSFLRDDLVSCM
jgi:hypothetical protein